MEQLAHDHGFHYSMDHELWYDVIERRRELQETKVRGVGGHTVTFHFDMEARIGCAMRLVVSARSAYIGKYDVAVVACNYSQTHVNAMRYPYYPIA